MQRKKKQNASSRTASPNLMRKKPRQTGGNIVIKNDIKNDTESEENITISRTSVLAVIAFCLLGVIVYLAYTKSEDDKQQYNLPVSQTPNQQNTVGKRINSEVGTISHHPSMSDNPATVMEVLGDNIPKTSFWGYLTAKNHERIINPLLPPERSYENTYGLPVNVPSRGFSGGFQQVGYLYKKDVANTDIQVGQDSSSVIIPLYGRPLWPGANKWNYYLNSDKFQAVKMPFQVQGRISDDDHGVNELNNGDTIDLPAYNGKFDVNIYNYDKPRYIPFI